MGIHIGVNALFLIPGGVGGTEIYLRSLLAALSHIDCRNRYTIFTNRETGTGLAPLAANFSSAPLPVSARHRPSRILWEQFRLPGRAQAAGVQVLFNPGFTAPLFPGRPSVTVFHDLQHKRHPEHFRWFDLPFWRFLLWAAVRRSRHLIAVSQATADDLSTYYGIPRSGVTVVPHGVDERFFEIGRARSAPDRMLLCVSTLHPHKNLDTLLRAFAVFQARTPGFRLVIAGLRGFATRHLESLRQELGLLESVEFTGWISREELYGLFLRASAFLYPSTFEGFGMPVLEALAAGVPTACSAIEPLQSIAGGAALLFDPHSVESIAGAMDCLVSSEQTRRRLSRDGPVRAACYSWNAAARATLDCLLQAVL